MAQGRRHQRIAVSPYQRQLLKKWARQKAPKGLVRRSRIVLACARGRSEEKVAKAVRVSCVTVRRCRRRFLDHGMEGLRDRPRRGAPRKITEAHVIEVIKLALESRLPNVRRWTTRSIAAKLSVSQSAIARIRRELGLPPHQDTIKHAKHVQVRRTVRAIVGLYVNGTDKGIAFCAEEEMGPVQALPSDDAKRRSYDHVRDGATSIFSALVAKAGKIVHRLRRGHRADAFRHFLDKIDAAVPRSLRIHLILAGRAPETPIVQNLLTPNQERFHVELASRGTSWTGLAQHSFRELTERNIRDSVACGTRPLEDAIRGYLATSDTTPRLFVWTKAQSRQSAAAGQTGPIPPPQPRSRPIPKPRWSQTTWRASLGDPPERLRDGTAALTR